MGRMIVEFEWDDELRPNWFNIDTLYSLLYNEAYTKPELLKATLMHYSNTTCTINDNNSMVVEYNLDLKIPPDNDITH